MYYPFENEIVRKKPRLWRSCEGIFQLLVCVDKSRCRESHGGVVNLRVGICLQTMMGLMMELLVFKIIDDDGKTLLGLLANDY
jgi:hypothetical protein